jgi:nucleoside-diphosphate-sugar epimerase
MTLMITGAGLVGAQIAALERAKGGTPVLFDLSPRLDALSEVVDLERCTVVRGDVTNALDLVRAVKENGVDHIIHTAAYPGFTGGAALAPVATVHVNVMGTVQVLETARLHDVERVVVCSSASIYASSEGGADAGVPMSEEAHPRTTTIYATTKLATEYLGLSYHHEFGLDVRAVRFNGVFGPWAGGTQGISAVMMESWLRGAMEGAAVVVDYPALEWVYAKDAARGALLALEVDDPSTRVFNIGMGMSLTPDEIAAALAEVVPGADVRGASPRTTPPQADKPAMDATRAADVLGYRAEYLLHDALVEYQTWLERRATR